MNNIKDFVIKDGVLVKYTGDDLEVVIPDSVTSIGYDAFANCVNLESIAIPNSVIEIEMGAFDGCKNLVITTPAGSYAEEYAKENGIKVNLI